MNRKHLLQAAAAAVVSTMPSALFAASYATDLSLSSGTTLNFRLNDAADEIVVIDGATTQTFAGPFTAGANSVMLSGAPAGDYQVVVKRNNAAGYNTGFPGQGTVLQIGVEIPFFAPRGVAVNTDPASAYFGRVYVSSATPGTTSAPFPPNYPAGRTTGRGMYAMNADLSDAIGQGDTAATGGLTFAASSVSPLKVEVGQDGNLYITDWSDPNGSIYRTDPNIGATSGINVLTGVGNPATDPNANHADTGGSAIVTGSEAAGNLTIWAHDSSFGGSGNFQRMYRWDAGSTVPTAVAPVPLANPLINTVSGVFADQDRSPVDSKFYMSQYRSVGTESGLFVLGTDANTVLWSSLTDTRQVFADPSAVDLLRTTLSIKISPDGTKAAIARDNGDLVVVPMLAGIPDLANVRFLDTTNFGGTRSDAAWDVAGNIYETSNGAEWLRVFGPGGQSVVVTGSNGTATAESVWKSATGGSFGTAANWLADNTPSNASATGYSAAQFGQSASAQTISVDAGTTVSTLRLKSSNGYTFTGNALTMDGFGSNVIVEQGSHTIAVPMQLNQSTGFSAVNTGDTLTVSGAVTTVAGAGLVKGGRGTVAFTGGVDTSNVNWVGVYEGTLDLGADIAGPGGIPQARVTVQTGATLNSGGIRATMLRVNGTTNVATNGTASGMVYVTRGDATVISAGMSGMYFGAAGVLNMNDNDLLLDYADGTPSPEFDLRDRVKAFVDNPAATSGINFTHGAGDVVLAIAEKTEWGFATFNGIPLDDTAIVGKYTYYGDSNLDGAVTSDDYVAVDVGLGTGDSWVQGDFNFSGTVTSDDYVAIDVNLGKGTPTPLAWAELKAEMVALHTAMFGAEYVEKLAYAEANGFAATMVPEPGALSLVGLGAIGLLGRRRRRTA